MYVCGYLRVQVFYLKLYHFSTTYENSLYLYAEGNVDIIFRWFIPSVSDSNSSVSYKQFKKWVALRDIRGCRSL